MAKFNDPKTEAGYLGNNANLSASFAASSDNRIDGVLFETSSISKIPARLDNGDQAKFVDLTKVVTGSGGGVFREPLSGLVYVPFRKKDIQDSLIGENSHIKNNFLPDSYLQISKSFASRFNSIGDNTIFNYLVEEFYTGSVEGFVGSATASLNTFTPDGLTSSFSGIDPATGYDMTFDFSNSNFVTNLELAFNPGGEAHTLRTATFIPKFQHKFTNRAGNTTNRCLVTSSLASINGILGVDTSATGSPSGSICGIGGSTSGTQVNINGSDTAAGTYTRNLIKGRVGGDGDSGSLASTYDDLLPRREYIIYPFGTVVASGSFRYYADTPNSAATSSSAARRVIITETTSSSDIRTLFYAAGGTNGPSGSHTGSRFLHGQDHKTLGSPVHADPLLQSTASIGFYAPLGSTISDGCYEINTASFDNGGSTLTPTLMMVPRIKSKVTVSGT